VPGTNYSSMTVSPASAGQARIGGIPMPAALMAVLDGLQDPLLLLDSKRRLIFRNAAAGRVLNVEGGFAVVGGRMPHGPGCLPVARKRIRRDWLLLVPAEIADATVLSGGSAEQGESVLSIRRIRIDEAHRHERPNRRAPLLSCLNSELYVGDPSCKREPHRPRVN
jgi:hypothetical protein